MFMAIKYYQKESEIVFKLFCFGLVVLYLSIALSNWSYYISGTIFMAGVVITLISLIGYLLDLVDFIKDALYENR